MIAGQLPRQALLHGAAVHNGVDEGLNVPEDTVKTYPGYC